MLQVSVQSLMAAELYVRAIACIKRYIQCPCRYIRSYVAGQFIKIRDRHLSLCFISLACMAADNTSVQKEPDLCPTL